MVQKPARLSNRLAALIDQLDPADDAAITFLHHPHHGILNAPRTARW